jgi:hypothetical protein
MMRTDDPGIAAEVWIMSSPYRGRKPKVCGGAPGTVCGIASSSFQMAPGLRIDVTQLVDTKVRCPCSAIFAKMGRIHAKWA